MYNVKEICDRYKIKISICSILECAYIYIYIYICIYCFSTVHMSRFA